MNIKKVGVLGCGLMGSGIAQVSAAAGYDVTVICPEPSEGAGASFNIDWGPRVHIEYVDWTAATFMSAKSRAASESSRSSPSAA